MHKCKKHKQQLKYSTDIIYRFYEFRKISTKMAEIFKTKWSTLIDKLNII